MLALHLFCSIISLSDYHNFSLHISPYSAAVCPEQVPSTLITSGRTTVHVLTASTYDSALGQIRSPREPTAPGAVLKQ